MTSDQTASLLYLGLWVAVLAGYVFMSGRRSLSQNLRHASLWVLIFIGAIVAFGLWDDLRSTVLPRQSVHAEGTRIEVPLANDGHYHMVLNVNGTNVQFVVDTGASDIVLTQRDAERVGLNPDELVYMGVANTANGQVSTAHVRLDNVTLGGVTDTGVTALVNGGEMQGSLLGMAYLNRFSEVSFGNGKMTLTR